MANNTLSKIIYCLVMMHSLFSVENTKLLPDKSPLLNNIKLYLFLHSKKDHRGPFPFSLKRLSGKNLERSHLSGTLAAAAGGPPAPAILSDLAGKNAPK
jgi:hypothetical protein